MKAKKETVEAIERSLFAARRRRGPEPAVPGEGWRANVMAEVRRRALMRAGTNRETFAARFAWRLSAVAACVALVLLIYAMREGFVDYEELAVRFLEDPVGFLI